MNEWQAKRDGEVIAHGSMATLPDAAQRRSLAAAGYKIYVDGKLYRRA